MQKRICIRTRLDSTAAIPNTTEETAEDRAEKTEENKKGRPKGLPLKWSILHSSGYFSGSDASCAYVLSGNGSVFFNLYGLNVCVPLSSGMTIGVGNVVSGNLALTTNIAFS